MIAGWTNPEVYALLPCVGVTLYLFAHHSFYVWRRPETARLSLWVAAWALVGATCQLARLFQVAATDPEAALYAHRVQYIMAVALAPVLTRYLADLIDDNRFLRQLSGALTALAVVAVPVALFTNLLGTDEVHARPGWAGAMFYGVVSGPLAPAVALLHWATFSMVGTLAARSAKLNRVDRVLILLPVALYVVVGTLDILDGLRVAQVPTLFPFAFMIQSASLALLSDLRLARLEEALEHRTQGLTERNAELDDALVLAKQATETRTRFVATISHEIRTPLAGVLGLAELLDRTELDADQQDLLSRLQGSGRLLHGLINDVLDFARIEAGHLQVSPTEFDVGSVIGDVVDGLAPAAHAKGLALESQVPLDLPRVKADRQHLAQILMNLVGNAIKFTDQGSVRVYAALTTKGNLVVAVEDSGIGIAHNHVDDLFRPFQQLDTADSRRHGGSGLGLAIVGELVEAMRGNIRVDSMPSRGSVFTVELPVTVGACTLEVPTKPDRTVVVVDPDGSLHWALQPLFHAWGVFPEVRATATGLGPQHLVFDATGGIGVRFAPIGEDHTPGVLRRPVRMSRVFAAIGCEVARPQLFPVATPAGCVLVVDDNEINRLVITRMVESLGYCVNAVPSGEAALDVVQAGASLHAVLMDCQMPGMDGFEATRQIRGIAPDLPVLALTANAVDTVRADALRAGMGAFLAKPIDLAALSDALQRCQADGVCSA